MRLNGRSIKNNLKKNTSLKIGNTKINKVNSILDFISVHNAFIRWIGVGMIIRRGDIFYADLRPVIGSEQGGIRPVLIVQNDTGNKHSPTVICAAITSRMHKAKLPTHVEILAQDNGIAKDSVILLEQVRTIDKTRLKERICHLEGEVLKEIDKALLISLSLNESA